MKFGVREICNVAIKAKKRETIGKMVFEPGMPIIYLDSAKTSTLEGVATTVYATGGRGNSRLIAWEGEKTLTFTVEDALLSPQGFAILAGAGLITPAVGAPLFVHTTSQVVAGMDETITLPTDEIIGQLKASPKGEIYAMKLDETGGISEAPKKITISGADPTETLTITGATEGDVYLIDYYIEQTTQIAQLEITPDKFGGFYYLEASTLFRRESDGLDLPAEIVIPKIKIQSNFTFAMASTGDPSTFTFTMDAFPDYTKFDKTKKMLCAIQIIGDDSIK